MLAAHHSKYTSYINDGEPEFSLKPATDAYPLALLPVGNKTLLSYQIEYLERNGVSKIIVVIEKKDMSKVEKYFHHYFRPSQEGTEVELVAI